MGSSGEKCSHASHAQAYTQSLEYVYIIHQDLSTAPVNWNRSDRPPGRLVKSRMGSNTSSTVAERSQVGRVSLPTRPTRIQGAERLNFYSRIQPGVRPS